MTLIETFTSAAADFRASLDRPTPGAYGGKALKIVTKLFDGNTDAELRTLVRRLSKAPVHPAIDRPALLVTIAEHFEHATNHQRRVADGKTYT